MKVYKIFVVVFSVFLILSCDNNENGGENIDPVTNVTAASFIGSVKLSWVAPSDSNYYYTLITYKNSDGDIVNKKVSTYDALEGVTNTTIGGFTDTNEHEFVLTAHSFSGASSSPVKIAGTPESTSEAKDYVLGTVTVESVDLGAKILWTNESGVAVNLYATYKNSKGIEVTDTIDASKTDSTELANPIYQTTDISIVAQNVGDDTKSDVKTITVSPIVNPDDIIQEGIDYLSFNLSTANSQMSITQPNSENQYQYKIITTGRDPHVEINKLVNPIQGKVLKFRYKASSSYTFELFWEDKGGGAAGGRSTALTVPATSDWTTFTYDYSSEISKYNWVGKVGDGIRWDPANASGITIEIRNIHFE